MSLTDTSPVAEAVQLQVQRAMSGEQRLLLALEMSLLTRELARQRIQQEHPDWSDAEVARELLRLAFLPSPLPAPFAMSATAVLRRITAALQQAQISYMLAGSFASAYYGAPVRAWFGVLTDQRWGKKSDGDISEGVTAADGCEGRDSSATRQRG